MLPYPTLRNGTALRHQNPISNSFRQNQTSDRWYLCSNSYYSPDVWNRSYIHPLSLQILTFPLVFSHIADKHIPMQAINPCCSLSVLQIPNWPYPLPILIHSCNHESHFPADHKYFACFPHSAEGFPTLADQKSFHSLSESHWGELLAVHFPPSHYLTISLLLFFQSIHPASLLYCFEYPYTLLPDIHRIYNLSDTESHSDYKSHDFPEILYSAKHILL